MAYSEADVLAGALMHIPVLIGLLTLFNAYTRRRGGDVSKDPLTEQKEAEQELPNKESKPDSVIEYIEPNLEDKEEKEDPQPNFQNGVASLDSKKIFDVEKEKPESTLEEEEQKDFEKRLEAEANRLEAEAARQSLSTSFSVTNQKNDSNSDLKATWKDLRTWQKRTLTLMILSIAALFTVQIYKNDPREFKDYPQQEFRSDLLDSK